MVEVYVEPHAFKHGISESDIRFAWGNYVARQYRGAPNEGQIVAIGLGRTGRAIEMVAIEREFGILIYHAFSPPTHSALKELGLLRRRDR